MKPCKICYTVASLATRWGAGQASIECAGCGAQGPACYTEAEAVQAWDDQQDQQAQDPSLPAVLSLPAGTVPLATDTQVGGSHYRGMAIQPVEFIERNQLGFLEGNVIKYVCRHRKKAGAADILKARHYLDLILQFRYPNADANASR